MSRVPKKKRARERTAAAARDLTKQRTRDALVAAGLELFAEEGLDAPSLDAICDRAGYTRGAFYVHFPDRDALLVAVMEKVGESFLSAVFADPQLPSYSASSLVAETAHRFVAAIASGTYPLMPPQDGKTRPRGPHIRPHQLLDACARSPVVRERYRSLVEASIAHLGHLVRADQATGAIDGTLDPERVGTMLLAIVIGVQTMADVGLRVDPAALTSTALAVLRS